MIASILEFFFSVPLPPFFHPCPFPPLSLYICLPFSFGYKEIKCLTQQLCSLLHKLLRTVPDSYYMLSVVVIFFIPRTHVFYLDLGFTAHMFVSFIVDSSSIV